MEVTLEQMLAAREARVQMQDELRKRYGAPVISFTMNIPGPIKYTPLIRRAFFVGHDALRSALSGAKLPVLWSGVQEAATGCEALFAVGGEALAVKRVCTDIEDANALGRLFDMDVLAPDGAKLDREAVGGGARNCIVCGAAGRGCASRRTHTVEELQAAARRIMEAHFAAADRDAAAKLVTRALLDEVYTTPKPGLVDRGNNGSHTDMTVETFERSAAALEPYWARCVSIGQATADEPPEATFAQLRAAGLDAERAMFAATGGVNTHKGAIFTLGVVCGAIGRLWTAEAPCRDTDVILQSCAAMTSAAMEADFAAITRETARTAGARLYLEHGLRGIRGEVADGLPGVRNVALPVLRRALDAGCSRNDAGVYALLALVARGTDSNMIARGGKDAADAASREAAALTAGGRFPPIPEVERLDRSFISRNLSPGGCADLLAAAYFLLDCTEAAAVDKP